MTPAPDLPAWAALVTSMLLLVGAFLAFTGSLGLLRLSSFYERVHAPTLGTTLGIGSVLLASMLFFSVLQSRPVLHDRRGLGGYDACHPLTAGARCSVPRPPGG